ncbi:phosphoadenylyl-sulfate reductase [Dyella monticola]|uniref:Phosphoadenosine 5'-phosphosulfate reductase n=1 Tax=Dyella monticola TaxID=1927958 RepID=A0A370WVM6_9GAMM|nr:phosphoadenylyl-sulfate reductase [Dyella monticola]RDS80140.1 phosphoadenylyl-sulfate reductase [Dyella monticola]
MSLPTPEQAANDARARVTLDARLLALSAQERIDWALQNLPGVHVLSSSFGAQSAVSLHLLTQRVPGIPVIVIDTGYLFPETYRFIDALTERLSLNLHVIRPNLSPAWLQARFGELWNQGREGLDHYNRLAKVEPMQRALSELGAGTWFAGLRRQQSLSRAASPVLDYRQGRWKVHPIVDWTDRDVGLYLRRFDLPYHPLWDKGYVSIGDVHTTRRWEPGMRDEDTRFFGIKRECGLHLDV